MRKIQTQTKFIPCGDKPLVVFFHGMFGTTLGPHAEGQLINSMNFLVEKNLASVYVYQTSRSIERDKKQDFKKWALLAFEGKSFKEELDDVSRALNQLINIELYDKTIFVGFSLGGTISTYFLEKYNPKTVLMFGSSCMTKSKDMPIGSSYPEKNQILNNLESYSGVVKIYQGTDDEVVPKEGAHEMWQAAKNAKRKELIVLQGVDHRFMHYNSLRDLTLDSYVVQEIVKSISEY